MRSHDGTDSYWEDLLGPHQAYALSVSLAGGDRQEVRGLLGPPPPGYDEWQAGKPLPTPLGVAMSGADIAEVQAAYGNLPRSAGGMALRALLFPVFLATRPEQRREFERRERAEGEARKAAFAELGQAMRVLRAELIVATKLLGRTLTHRINNFGVDLPAAGPPARERFKPRLVVNNSTIRHHDRR